MNYVMQGYDDTLARILASGLKKPDRTGIGCLSLAGLQCRYPLGGRFPLLSRRKVWPRAIFAELIWFLSGSTNTNDLNALGAKFWDRWKDQKFESKHGLSDGDLGPIYGFQLRHFGGDYATRSGGFDQLGYMDSEMRVNPHSRRILFSLWNGNDMPMQVLPPCHYSYQIVVDGDLGLTGILTQRSADYPVGVPANIQFYSALTMMFAQQHGCRAREFVHNTGDAHIYLDQVDAVERYLASPVVDSPSLEIKRANDIFSYAPDDFVVSEYAPGPRIDVPVAV